VLVAAPGARASGPAAAWGFDGPSPGIVDSVGHTTASARGVRLAKGRYGRGLAFRGRHAVVTVRGRAPRPARGLTLEAWVKPTARLRRRTPLILLGAARHPVYALYAGDRRARPAVRLFRRRGRAVHARSRLRLRRWTFLAASWNGRALRLYAGDRLVTRKRVRGRLRGRHAELRLGGAGGRGPSLRGRVDELRIYDRGLSAARIRADRRTPVSRLRAGGGAPAPSPVASAPVVRDPRIDAPCVLTVNTTAAAQAAVQDPANADVCLAAGSYGALVLTRARSSFVTVRPVPHAPVTIAGASIRTGAGHYRFLALVVRGNFEFYPGANNIELLYNDIAPAPTTYSAVLGLTTDCTVPHSPSYSGCVANPPMTDVLVKGNRFHDYRTPDNRTPLRPSNWRRLTIVENEITGVLSWVGADGAISHTDCFQSIYGGDQVTFARNYVHDTRCQGFFIKDGDASNVVLDDNLFVRNNVPPIGPGAGASDFPCGAPATVTVQYVTHFSETRNTVWPGQCAGGNEFLENGGSDYRASLNVIDTFLPHDEFVSTDAQPGAWAHLLSEDYNVFCSGWTWVPGHDGPHDTVSCNPPFADPSHDDYRLTRPVTAGGQTFTPGVTWAPSQYLYGPG
jgi:hypothetical protein